MEINTLISSQSQDWIYFNLGVVALLILDLGVFNKKAHVIKIKEAIGWSIFWIFLATLYGIYIYTSRGATLATEYFTAYVVEKSLSVDNLFVFAIIFETFKIERKHQHRLLFWGVLGAIVLRATMILAGSALLERFHFLIYVFGAILLFTGIKFLLKKGSDHFEPKKSKTYRLAQKFLPLTDVPHDGHFRRLDPQKGYKAFTLYFVALLVIETTDVLFAVDSVPAVLAISRDPFIVYTSNIFAILGLRALFFVLEDLLERFYYLQSALGVILSYVGIKMLIEYWYKIPVPVNLAVILGTLFISILMSFLLDKKKLRAKA
ncbi:MAG: TerC family protein [Bdellovibrionota bacterium]